MMLQDITGKIYSQAIQEIHSFDAYYKNVSFSGSDLIIPYINLGISNHPINETEKLHFLNYCYMVFKEINFLTVYVGDKRYKVIDRDTSCEKVYFGGQYLDYGIFIFNDLEISCNNCYLKTTRETKLSDKQWLITKTENNNFLSTEEVESFFNIAFM